LRHIYALVLVTISWTLFAFTEISKGAAWCKAMLSGVLFDSSSLYLLLTYGPMLAICALAATPLGKRFYKKLGTRLGQRALTVVDCGGLGRFLRYLELLGAVGHRHTIRPWRGRSGCGAQ
jgi:hypothetical protein